MHKPRPSPALLSRPRAHRATWRGGEKNGHGPPSLRVGATLGGVDVGAAVEEAVMVGRTGGDPVPTLTALYERIGFCAVQGEDGDDEGMQSLPTSPKRAVPGNTQREYGVQNRNNDEGMYRQRPGDRAGVDGFFPNDSPKELRSPTRWATGRKVDVGKSEPSDDRGGHGKGNGIKGYSFAHSPLTKVTSVAERSPEVLKRLEALASQLERERADVEQWYKEVVHRVGLAPASSQGLDVVILRAQRNRSTRCLVVLNRTSKKKNMLLCARRRPSRNVHSRQRASLPRKCLLCFGSYFRISDFNTLPLSAVGFRHQTFCLMIGKSWRARERNWRRS